MWGLRTDDFTVLQPRNSRCWISLDVTLKLRVMTSSLTDPRPRGVHHWCKFHVQFDGGLIRWLYCIVRDTVVVASIGFIDVLYTQYIASMDGKR